MPPEEKEHEENLAALVASNLSALQTADAVEKSVEIAETRGGSLTGDVLTIRFATSICTKTPPT